MDLNKYFDVEPIFSEAELKKFKKKIELIDALLEELRKYPSSEFVYNQYQHHSQLENLRIYLYLHLKYDSKILLIGEAGGYKGAKLTGIPFTSGYKIAHDPIFVKIKQYFHCQCIEDVEERSASAFYEFFNSYPQTWEKITMWNAFPFHPHNIKFDDSNRTPTKKELERGLFFF